MEKFYDTLSVCPYCLKVVKAVVYEEDGAVYIEKECREHGKFKHVYWSDAGMFKRAFLYKADGKGLENPQVKGNLKGCPYDCGLCPLHKSHTALGLIDVTNRCNLHCPICFAAAFAKGYVYEPSLNQVKAMLNLLRNNKPVPCPAVQLTGGEPTLREDLVEMVRYAKEVAGFKHVEIDTNGIRIAKEDGYAEKLAEAGGTTIYLSFEGLEPKAYGHKGANLLNIKLKAIERCREAGIGVVLVPTLTKTINDDQPGKIIEFAAENVDVIRCVNFQPISFVGRFNPDDVNRYRITIPEAIERIEKQTKGKIRKEDFYPVPTVVPLSRFIAALEGEPKVEFSTHPCCGMATYIYVEEDGSYTPITRFVKVDELLKLLKEETPLLEKGGKFTKLRVLIKVLRKLPSMVNKDELPPELDITSLIKNLLVKRDYKALAKFHLSRMIMIGMMHFQDSLNLDMERLMRCCIHYAVPDGRLIPFCAMNLTDIHGRGLYRKPIEEKYSIPLEEWEKIHGVPQSEPA